MRAYSVAVAILATMLASSAFAQQPTPAPRTFMNNKEIMGLVDKAKADRKGDAPLVAEPIARALSGPARIPSGHLAGGRTREGRGADGGARRYWRHRDRRQARRREAHQRQ